MRGPSRRLLFALAGGSAAAFLLLTLCVVTGIAPLRQVDGAVSVAAHRTALSHPAWRAAMIHLTGTAGSRFLLPLGALLALLLLYRGARRQAAFVVAAVLLTGGARLLVRAAVATPRPAEGLVIAHGWSYPSGHTTAATTAALIVVLLLWPALRRGWPRRAVVAVAGAWAVLIGVSRVALVVHWPTDVLGGWLLPLAVVPVVAGVLLPTRPAPSVTTAEA